eukprot:5193124-Amphidinium_carterae.1
MLTGFKNGKTRCRGVSVYSPLTSPSFEPHPEPQVQQPNMSKIAIFLNTRHALRVQLEWVFQKLLAQRLKNVPSQRVNCTLDREVQVYNLHWTVWLKYAGQRDA